VNEALLGALEKVKNGELPPRPVGLQILWATGPKQFESVQQKLAPLALPWVHAVAYIERMPEALAATDIALTRAGAMATAELLAWGVPMLLVPLPTAAADHQTHNARALAEAGAGVFLAEADVTPERLWHEIVSLAGDNARRLEMSARARERARPNAAQEIARKLLTLMEAA
jgi:UDP-N-acetylglucosamine--N-acetylmuramyl-(pentapeptide) pyrophosphoryl-undecaprenol N-acetylglucosamine transferase